MLKFIEKSGSYTSLICLDEILIIMICNSIHMFQSPVTVASKLLEEEAGADPSDKEMVATPTRETTANATTESSST